MIKKLFILFLKLIFFLCLGAIILFAVSLFLSDRPQMEENSNIDIIKDLEPEEPEETEEYTTEEIEETTEEPLETFNDINDLAVHIENCLKEGKVQTKAKIEDIDKDDIHNINSFIVNYYGYVDTYEFTEADSSRTYDFYLKISDQYYIEHFFKNNEPIPEERGNARTLAKKVQEILDELDIEDDTNYRKEKKIHDYLVSHLTYDDSKSKGSTTVYYALMKGSCICEGYSKSMKLLCNVSGVPCEIITGTGNEEPHMWNLVQLNGNWYHVDVTWDDQNSKDNIIYPYFNVSDEYIYKHTWDIDRFPVCNHMDFNYYVINKSFCHSFSEFQEYCLSMAYKKESGFQTYVLDLRKEDLSKENMSFLFENKKISKYQFLTYEFQDNQVVIMDIDYR